MKKERCGSLDLLKFVAAIVIACLYHYRNMSIGGAMDGVAESYLFEGIFIIDWFSNNGWYFVEFFFIVSGMMTYRAYYKKIIEGELFWEFYLRRCKRLLPLVFITTIVMAIGQWVTYIEKNVFWMSMGNNSLSQLVQHMIGINIWLGTEQWSFNQPTWYISVCLFCYIIFYITASFNRSGKRQWIFFIPIYLGMTCGNIGIAFLNPLIARGLLAFFIGVVIEIFLEKNYSYLLYLGISLSILVTISMAYIMSGWDFFGDKLFVFETFIFPSVLIIVTKSRILKILFNNQFSYYLGELSFGIYLWNIPIFMITSIINKMFNFNLRYNSLKMFIFIFIIHFLVSTISLEIIERRLVPYLLKYIKDIKKTSNINI